MDKKEQGLHYLYAAILSFLVVYNVYSAWTDDLLRTGHIGHTVWVPLLYLSTLSGSQGQACVRNHDTVKPADSTARSNVNNAYYGHTANSKETQQGLFKLISFCSPYTCNFLQRPYTNPIFRSMSNTPVGPRTASLDDSNLECWGASFLNNSGWSGTIQTESDLDIIAVGDTQRLFGQRNNRRQSIMDEILLADLGTTHMQSPIRHVSTLNSTTPPQLPDNRPKGRNARIPSDSSASGAQVNIQHKSGNDGIAEIIASIQASEKKIMGQQADEFKLLRDDVNKTHNELLNRLEAHEARSNERFEKVDDQINTLTTGQKDQSNKIAQFKCEIDSRISQLEGKIEAFSISDFNDYLNIVTKDGVFKSPRIFNLVVEGLNSDTSIPLENKIIQLLRKCVNDIDKGEIKFIGRRKRQKPRIINGCAMPDPVLVCLSSALRRNEILRNKNKLRGENCYIDPDDRYPVIRIKSFLRRVAKYCNELEGEGYAKHTGVRIVINNITFSGLDLLNISAVYIPKSMEMRELRDLQKIIREEYAVKQPQMQPIQPQISSDQITSNSEYNGASLKRVDITLSNGMYTTQQGLIIATNECILSRNHCRSIMYEGRIFMCLDHLFLWLKCIELGDKQLVMSIEQEKSMANVYRLTLGLYGGANWKSQRLEVMLFALEIAFAFDDDRSDALESTGEVCIIEGSRSIVWGGGADHDSIVYTDGGFDGLNEYGTCLVIIRSRRRDPDYVLHDGLGACGNQQTSTLVTEEKEDAEKNDIQDEEDLNQIVLLLHLYVCPVVLYQQLCPCFVDAAVNLIH